MKRAIVPTKRTTLKRVADRGTFDRERIYAILDEGLLCHVGIAPDGQPVVIPMAYARQGDRLVLHGSVGSRLMRGLREGLEACVTVTLLDGLVLARSAFHHSMNYRSVVAFGTATLIEDEAERRQALDALVEHLVPGRTADARAADRKELAATAVLAFPLTEASAKVRSGPPVDEEADLALDMWAGEIPLELAPQGPVPAPELPPDAAPPDYVAHYRRPGTTGRRDG